MIEFKHIAKMIPVLTNDPIDGLCPTMYATGSYQGDIDIVTEIKALIADADKLNKAVQAYKQAHDSYQGQFELKRTRDALFSCI